MLVWVLVVFLGYNTINLIFQQIYPPLPIFESKKINTSEISSNIPPTARSPSAPILCHVKIRSLPVPKLNEWVAINISLLPLQNILILPLNMLPPVLKRCQKWMTL